jgi:DNA-binding response OmpR family regulator
MTIVIIEDERDLGILMRNFLERQLNSKNNSIIKLFSNLTEGMDCIRQLNPDWVFIDNNLPDGKGIDEIGNIKSFHQSKPSRIIMMSAMTNLREEAFRKGADYFLDKPISFIEVKSIFDRLSEAE